MGKWVGISEVTHDEAWILKSINSRRYAAYNCSIELLMLEEAGERLAGRRVPHPRDTSATATGVRQRPVNRAGRGRPDG
jgi:hypothetical protein